MSKCGSIQNQKLLASAVARRYLFNRTQGASLLRSPYSIRCPMEAARLKGQPYEPYTLQFLGHCLPPPQVQELRMDVHTRHKADTDGPPDGFCYPPLVDWSQASQPRMLDAAHLRHIFRHQREVLSAGQRMPGSQPGSQPYTTSTSGINFNNHHRPYAPCIR